MLPTAEPYGPGCWDTARPPVTPTPEEQLPHWRAGFAFRRTSTSQRNRLDGTMWRSTTAHAKSKAPQAVSDPRWSSGPAETELLTGWKDPREGRYGTGAPDVHGGAGPRGLVSLEKKRPAGYVIILPLPWSYGEHRARLFSETRCKRTRGNSHRLQRGKCCLERWKKKSLQQDGCITEAGA